MEDLLSGGATSSASGAASSEGLRGFAAREAWKNYLTRESKVVRSEVRERIATKLAIQTSELTPLSIREFFEQKVPLGSSSTNHRLLTQLAMLASRGWELVERDDIEGLQTLPTLMALFVEQLSIDQSAKG